MGMYFFYHKNKANSNTLWFNANAQNKYFCDSKNIGLNFTSYQYFLKVIGTFPWTHLMRIKCWLFLNWFLRVSTNLNPTFRNFRHDAWVQMQLFHSGTLGLWQLSTLHLLASTLWICVSLLSRFNKNRPLFKGAWP